MLEGNRERVQKLTGGDLGVHSCQGSTGPCTRRLRRNLLSPHLHASRMAVSHTWRCSVRGSSKGYAPPWELTVQVGRERPEAVSLGMSMGT